MERFVIDKFQGVSRNPVEGADVGPDELNNLFFDRAGGYIPHARSALGGNLFTSALLVDYDHRGFGLIANPNVTTTTGASSYSLIEQSSSSPYFTQPGGNQVGSSILIPGVGMYLNNGTFTVKDIEGTYRTGEDVFSPSIEVYDTVNVGTSGIAANDDLYVVLAGDNGSGTERFVAAGTGTNDIYYSSDGLAWTAATYSGTPSTFYCGAFDSANNVFMLGGLAEEYHTSSDGITWTDRSANIPFAGATEGVAHIAVNDAGDQFVFAGCRNTPDDVLRLAYSTSATGTITVADIDNTSVGSPLGVTWDGLQFVLYTAKTSTSEHRVYVSSDGGATWTLKATNPSEAWRLVDGSAAFSGYKFAWVDDRYVLPAQEYIYYSKNKENPGQGWSRVYTGLDLSNSDVVYTVDKCGGVWVASGTNGKVLYSQDFVVWEEYAGVVAENYHDIACADAGHAVHVGVDSDGTGGTNALTIGANLDAGTYYVLVTSNVFTGEGKLLREYIISEVDATSGSKTVVVRADASQPSSYITDVYLDVGDGSATLDRPTYQLTGSLKAGETYSVSRADAETAGYVFGDDGVGNVLNADQVKTEIHLGRLWFVLSRDTTFDLVNTGASLNTFSDPLSVGYSMQRQLNVCSPFAFVKLNVTQSASITDIVSGPGQRLYVFCDNEIFAIYGDPSFANAGRVENFGVTRISEGVGHNGGSRVAKVGGLLFCIHNGEIYMLNGEGPPENVSRGVFRSDDEFVRVVGDASGNQLVARTDDGNFFRFDLPTGQWFNSVDGDVLTAFSFLFPGSDSVGVRTFGTTSGSLIVKSSVLLAPNETQSCSFKYEALDLGDKNLMKLWRRCSVFTNAAYDGAPTLTYSVRGSAGSVNGLDQGDGRWVFTLPRGLVGATADLTFAFPSMGEFEVVESPLVVEYAVRYRER